MEINTKRLRIREMREEDWPAMQAIFADFNRSKLAKYDRPMPEADDEARALTRAFAESGLFFSVLLNGAPIGYIGFHEDGGKYDLGYCFSSAHHSRGYACESAQAVLEYMRRARNAQVFTAGTALDNLPSRRLLEKLGFRLVSTQTMSFDGQFSFEGGNYRLDLRSETT